MSFVTNPVHALTFGASGINLIGTDADMAANGYKIEALSDETEWSNPVPIEQQIISWLQDGAIVGLQGYDNREFPIKVEITATDGNYLALAEKLLMLETGKPNILTWTPPDGVAQPTVFEIVISYLEHEMDDFNELLLKRTWRLRIKALPFTRAVNSVTVTRPAPTPSGSITVASIDPCTSTSGWTGTPNAPTTNGTAVLESRSVPAFQQPGGFVLERSGLSINMAATPYLRIDFGYNGTISALTVKLNLNAVAPVATVGTVSWYPFSGTLNDVNIQLFDGTSSTVALTRVLSVADLSRSSAPADPSGQTGRQVSGVLPVAGSARTQGNLAIYDPSASLGDVLVYTCPADSNLIQPNLRTWLQAGPTPTTDATTVSGVTSVLTTPHVFMVPVTGLQPGGYVLMARLKHTATATYAIGYNAAGVQGATSLPDPQAGTTNVALTANVWKFADIAQLNLPPRKLGKNGFVAVTLTSVSSVIIDEAWLLNIETGDVTLVSAGSGSPAAGGPSNRLWLDAPSVYLPAPGVYLGNASDRSDSFHLGSEMVSMGIHECKPTLLNVFTVTTGSIASVVDLTLHARFHTHVAA